MDDALIRDLQSRLGAALGTEFAIGELLGAGGFAAVFRAHDPVLGRDVAIKVLNPSLALGPEAAERLLDEARLVAAIEHPHIVPLYEAANRGGMTVLVMRYYPDGTVGTRLSREGPLPAGDVARLGIEVADALAAAHARGVVHLDVKPDNILLDGDGHAAVADFGIARVIAGADQAPEGTSSGTPHYMSPEQVAGDRLDGRADVYALGVVLYELATGQRPVGGDSAVKVMANQVRQAPAALSVVAPELPAALAGVITRALAKDPAARWPSAAEMADALRAASAPDQLLSPRMARRRARRRWYVRMAMVAGGVLTGAGLLVYAAIRVWLGFQTGDAPGLDAMAPRIPAAVLDSARSGGVISDGDTVLYVFAPHGQGIMDGLLVTTRDVIAAGGGRPRRYAIAEDPDIRLNRVSGRVYVIITPQPAGRADTVYSSMSGLEQQILGLALRRTLLATPPR